MNDPKLTLPIGAVEKETRVSKELLRMWERRYGFPSPQRDAAGDRMYTREDVEKLKLIRHLIDRGFRPGRLMGLANADLTELQNGSAAIAAPIISQTPAAGPGEELVAILRRRDVDTLRRWLSRQLSEHGLRWFITQTIREANMAVGAAWARGELVIHEEHLYTEQVQMLLRQSLYHLYPSARTPRVMLTTAPDEPHMLGLLMAEVMLRLEQCDILSFGTEMPLTDIVEAAEAHSVDIVALSFSGAYGEANARRTLVSLAAMLPRHMTIWAGGAGVANLDDIAPSIYTLLDLDQIGPAVAAWRAMRG